ncbi:hypothetical protein SUGI_0073380 [Cryptomeria japonica]|nr:hypothetical protein SUGI_0073380 [Cryptomeria japonica]
MRSAWLSASHNAFEEGGESIVLSLDLPAPLKFHKHEIDPNLFDPIMLQFLGRLQSLNESCGMLINTFEQLELEYLQHLRKQIGKVWSVGPALPPSSSGRASWGKMADIGEEQLLQWLESQNPSLVVYISFGSQTFLSEEQSKVLVCGLESREQPFIWAIKVSPKIELLLSDTPLDLSRTCLPEGFHEHTKNRWLGHCSFLFSHIHLWVLS